MKSFGRGLTVSTLSVLNVLSACSSSGKAADAHPASIDAAPTSIDASQVTVDSSIVTIDAHETADASPPDAAAPDATPPASTVVNTITVGHQPSAVVANSTTFWVSCFADDAIYQFDIANHTIGGSAEYRFGEGAVGLAVDAAVGLSASTAPAGNLKRGSDGPAYQSSQPGVF